jgi:hypothetical protein
MAGEMSWVGKKIHLYNVTMGLYMLDWWERCLFSILPPRLDRIQFLYYLTNSDLASLDTVIN